jgi:hypothetical protein
MRLCFFLIPLFFAVPVHADTGHPVSKKGPIDLQTARKSMAGSWEGQLEYLDYGAKQWFGIPVKINIEDQGDGVTLTRKSDFDDGPTIGNVRITSVELFDPIKKTLTVGSFRKGRTPELITYTINLSGPAFDSTHWTIVEETDSKDDNRSARLRLTTVRNGDALQTLKEVDYQDDNKIEWMQRNRTTLRLKK